MKDKESVKLGEVDLREMSNKADALIIGKDKLGLEKHVNELASANFAFECPAHEAQFLYLMGNCYQVLYTNREMDWFSDDLSKAVIFFRKAMNAISKSASLDKSELYLISCIETNLANSLSAQGRAFCCIPLWDSAIAKSNPIAIICKAQNELYLSNVLYDPGHQEYHLFIAYNLVVKGLKYKNYLYEEQQAAFHEGNELMVFKKWFENNFTEEYFRKLELQTYSFKTRKQKKYVEWCASNQLFINDLNDVTSAGFACQDIISLPDFSYKVNLSLSMYESLMYHGNFDELKNDYCYARYLFYMALNTPPR